MKKVTLMQPDTVLAFITDNSCEVSVCDKKGMVTSKVIEVDDFLKILGSSDAVINLNPNKMMPFELGSNIIKIRYCEDGILFYVFLPKGKYVFNNSGKRMKVNYPNLLFQIAVDKDNRASRSRMFAVKDEDIIKTKVWGLSKYSIKPDATMMIYPFGNVSTNGNICWGGNVFPEVSSYENIMEIVNLFLDTPTTAHYCLADFVEGKDRKKLLEKLVTESFDDALLMKSDFLYEKI